MSDKSKDWYEIIRTFWPVFLFLTIIIVWMVKTGTVSSTSFTKLQTRVTIVEGKIPTKETMVKVEADLAVMKSQLSTLTKNMDVILKKLIGKG